MIWACPPSDGDVKSQWLSQDFFRGLSLSAASLVIDGMPVAKLLQRAFMRTVH